MYILGEDNSTGNVCSHSINSIVKKFTINTPCITTLHCWIDFNFISLLNIIETKCVHEFDVVNVLGEDNSIVNVSA